MKLYLSSMGIPDKPSLLSLLPPDNLSVAIIPNAWDIYSPDRKDKELDNIKQTFLDLDFEVSTIDLRDNQGDSLKTKLLKHNLLWFTGGNVFYLNELSHKSGFSNIIKELLDNGVVYGGESAGAVLSGRTLHGVENLDDLNKAGEVIWSGLGLLNFSIIPHWGAEKYADSLNACRAEMEKHSKIKTLTNDQALIINGEDINSVIVS